MRITKTYDDNFIGKKMRENEEKKLFAKGFKVESEEEVKETNGRQACCLAIVFLPLALIPLLVKQKRIKVVYTDEFEKRADGSER